MSAMDPVELADRAGVAEERVRRMIELGLLEGDAGGYPPLAIARVRMADALDRAGIDLEDVAELVATDRYSMRWVDAVSGEPVPLSGSTLAGAAAELDVPLEFARRAYAVIWQLPIPGDDERIREDDLELLRIAAFVYHLNGRDEDRTVAAGRYFGDNLRRLAESQTRLFREGFEEPLLGSGMAQVDVMAATVELATTLIPLGNRVVELLYRRHFEHYSLEDIVTNMEIALERAGMAQRRGGGLPAIGFLDLTGYTSLTESAGDEEAARLTERFAELMILRTEQHGGRTVKLLGDGAMFHFAEPAKAVTCALELVDAVLEAGLPPAHAGLNCGTVVFRDSDYFGRTVNLAARVTERAGPGEVLVTPGIVEAVAGAGLAFEPVGSAALKGFREPVELYRAGVGDA
jgi:class 3 adenylate cyclase